MRLRRIYDILIYSDFIILFIIYSLLFGQFVIKSLKNNMRYRYFIAVIICFFGLVTCCFNYVMYPRISLVLMAKIKVIFVMSTFIIDNIFTSKLSEGKLHWSSKLSYIISYIDILMLYFIGTNT